MLDPVPNPMPPRHRAVLSALAARADVERQAVAEGVSPERVRADIALTVAFDRVADLRRAMDRSVGDTAEDARRVMLAAQDAAQAMVCAFVSVRERVRAG